MRGWWAVAVLLVAGCSGPSSSPHAAAADATALPHLEATYTYATVSQGFWMYGNFTVRTVDPRMVADRDMVPRMAWRVATELRYKIPDGPWPGGGQEMWWKGTTSLDGSFHAVRWEGTTSYQTYQPPSVDWGVQGQLAPFGLGWPRWGDAAPVQLDGTNGTVTFAHEREGIVLPKDSLTAIHGPDPDARYRYDEAGGPWLPIQVYARHDHPDMPLREEWFNRTAFTIGAPYDAVPSWPIKPYVDAGKGVDKFLPGEQEVAFHMGMTYAQAIAEIERQKPESKKDFDEGCIEWAMVYGSGAFFPSGVGAAQPVTDLAGLDRDSIFFDFMIQRGGLRTNWGLSYSPDPSVLGAVERQAGIAQDATADGGDVSPASHDARCPALPLPQAAPIAGARTVWRLPTPETGVPCSLTFQRHSLQHRDRTNTDGDPMLSFGLVRGPEQSARGRDQTYGIGSGSIALNVRSGYWQEGYLQPADLTSLDAGAAIDHPRPLPTISTSGVLGDPPAYYCVEPDLPDIIPWT